MTAARQKQKRYRAGLALATCLGLVLSAAAPGLGAALTQSIVVDRHSGLAIGGYDPVAFFTDGKPMIGRGDVELRYDGVVWRFRNEGNRAAFVERPDVYMPQFGGYDPLGVAHGVAVPGNPDLWVIVGERLFLFYDHARRDQFVASSERFIAAAERKWPDVLAALSP